MGNDFYSPTGYENEGLPSGRNLEGQIALWHPVLNQCQKSQLTDETNFDISIGKIKIIQTLDIIPRIFFGTS